MKNISKQCCGKCCRKDKDGLQSKSLGVQPLLTQSFGGVRYSTGLAALVQGVCPARGAGRCTAFAAAANTDKCRLCLCACNKLQSKEAHNAWFSSQLMVTSPGHLYPLLQGQAHLLLMLLLLAIRTHFARWARFDTCQQSDVLLLTAICMTLEGRSSSVSVIRCMCAS
jgi:hypothetical protein